MLDSVLNQFKNAGLLVDSIKTDTADIVRCKTEGDKSGKTSGWYRVYTVISQKGNTYYVGSYGNWRNGAIPPEGLKIEFEQKELSPADLKAIKDKQEQAQKEAEQQKKQKACEAKKRAQQILLISMQN